MHVGWYTTVTALDLLTVADLRNKGGKPPNITLTDEWAGQQIGFSALSHGL